ncbi:MAG: sulfurtransferase TusA family protein [Planctomycetota bacterium]
MAPTPSCYLTVDLTGHPLEEITPTLDNATADMQDGQELAVVTSDSNASLDVATWCRQRHHELTHSSVKAGVYRAQIRVRAS